MAKLKPTRKATRKRSPVKKAKKKPIKQYEHKGKKRTNNPPVGLVTPDTDKDGPKKTYQYDPHLDPQLVWAGKAEHTSFEVPTVSLHVHERIDPRSIIEAVRKRNDNGEKQISLFQGAEENPPLREAIEFYKHKHNWTNRLIAGDSLLVMNSLLEKEGMAGKVQMVYIDPPYGITYKSNFQPFVNRRDVKDGKDEDLTAEPEMVKAFRDTWELGIHSYLTYLRDRLLLTKELLHDSGSLFVQIGDENVHLVRDLLDEVFGRGGFVGQVCFRKPGGFSSSGLDAVSDYLLWYCRDRSALKYHNLYRDKTGRDRPSIYRWLRLADESFRRMNEAELNDPEVCPKGSSIVAMDNLSSMDPASEPQPYEFEGHTYYPSTNCHWKVKHPEGLDRLAELGRLYPIGNSLMYVRHLDDFPVMSFDNMWNDTSAGGFSGRKVYVVQTNVKVLERCILMTTDPGDLVLDPTCGSGTTALVAEHWGRRWATCDTSRVALALAKQRLMTAVFDYFALAHASEGIGSGLLYETVPHITLKSLAHDELAPQEALRDRPTVDAGRMRVSGPLTVEAVPAPAVRPLSDVREDLPADDSVARKGETLRQSEWKDELFQTGIRGKKGQRIEFTRLETLPGTRHLHADGETKEDTPQRVVVSFGPEHAPMEQRQVALAIEEAQRLVPKPTMVVFAYFQADPEAAKDIDETDWPGVVLLRAQMNADLLTEDLKKKRSSNESFWLVGQPDVKVTPIKKGDDKGKLQVEVLGFDYYNTRTGNIESGGKANIAMWMLDTDYDGRSIFPSQVFFPMAGPKDGWARLARNLKAEIDEDLIEAYRGTVSLPFELGDNKRVAVKIVDDRGIESLKVIEV